MNHTRSAMKAGTAMRALPGIWNVGMISVMLVNRMKKNIASKNGVQPKPSRPIVCITMPSWMKSMEASATFLAPLGAAVASPRPASTNSNTVSNMANTPIKATLLNPNGPKLGHTKMWEIGGNSRPSITSATVLYGLESRECQRGRHVSELPEQQTHVGHDDGHAERNQLHPRRVLHQEHGNGHEAKPNQEAEHHPDHEQRQRYAGAEGDDGGGEHEVHQHQGDPVGHRPHAVEAPEQEADERQKRRYRRA